MRRGQRVKTGSQPIADPERIVYIVPQDKPIPVEIPVIREPAKVAK